MRILITVSLLFFAFPTFLSAQVGIGTTTPNATLDIPATNPTNPANTDGILIPRINAFPATNPTAAQHGMMVFLMVTSGSNVPGMYYWNNPTLSWIGVGTNTSGGWNLNGNSGTVATAHFLGTTDDVPLNFRVNNQKAGLVDATTYNSTFGYMAGSSFSVGIKNVAMGYGASLSNTAGSSNTSVGFQALNFNTVGNENVAVGYIAGYHAMGSANSFVGAYSGAGSGPDGTGVYNSGLGTASLYQLTNGSGNTGIGVSSLRYLTTTSDNTGIGLNSGFFTTGSENTYAGAYSAVGIENASTGSKNSTLGAYSLYRNTTGNENTAVGHSSLGNNTSGSFNLAVGNSAMRSNSTGNHNTALGDLSLRSNTAGQYNVAVGSGAALNTAQSSGNVAVGANALHDQSFFGGPPYLSHNTAVGYSAMFMTNANSMTTGIGNTAVGSTALEANQTGAENTAVGFKSGQYVGGSSNSFFGARAGTGPAFGRTGTDNTGVGASSLRGIGNGSANTALGVSSLQSLTIANHNTAVGFESGLFITNASENTHVGAFAGRGTINAVATGNSSLGAYALYRNDRGNSNTAIGHSVFREIVTGGSDNTGVGFHAGRFATGTGNTYLGMASGLGIVGQSNGGNNAAVGINALSGNTTGSNNAVLGAYSMHSNTSGSGNTAVGNSAFREVTTNGSNTGVGIDAGRNATGEGNVFLGALAGTGVLGSNTGNYNVAIGLSALKSIGSGNENTGIGATALQNTTTGINNTALGLNSGFENTSGSGNTYLGAQATGTAALTYAVAIGANSRVNCSNCLVLGGTDASTRTRVGINTAAPVAAFEINQTGVIPASGIGLRYLNTNWNIYNNFAGLAFAYNNTLASFILPGGTYVTSDRRLKSDIKPLESILDRVMKLEPSRYVYNSEPSTAKIGFIAQEVSAVFPEFVGESLSDGQKIYGVDYANLSALSIKAIQELKAETDKIRMLEEQLILEQEKNKKLEASFLELLQRVENLERR